MLDKNMKEATMENGNGVAFSADWLSNKTEGLTRWLGKFAGKDGVRGLEIGSFEGRSAIWFMENILTGAGNFMTCVDAWTPTAELMAMGINWSDAEKVFDSNIVASGHGERVFKHKGPSFDVLKTLKDATYDFVYVDGSHRADHVLEDAVMSYRLLKDHGVMVFDDYNLLRYQNPALNPKAGVDAFLACYGHNLSVLGWEEQVFVEKVPKNYAVGQFKTKTPDSFIVEPVNA